MLLGAVGCSEALPDVRVIKSTRILAVRIDVTEPLVEEDPDAAIRCQALPFETVTITPFVVDPDGPVDPIAIDPVWIACQLNPGAGLFGCISSTFPTSIADIPDCVPPDLMGLEAGEIPDAQSPCLIGRDPTPEFVVPFNSSVLIGGDIEVTMIGSKPGHYWANR